MQEPTVYEAVTAIISCRQLQAHGRRHRIISAIAAILADDDYDDAPIESVIDAAGDHEITIDYGIAVSFPSSACESCLTELPYGTHACARCRAAGFVPALRGVNDRPVAVCRDCGSAMHGTREEGFWCRACGCQLAATAPGQFPDPLTSFPDIGA